MQRELFAHNKQLTCPCILFAEQFMEFDEDNSGDIGKLLPAPLVGFLPSPSQREREREREGGGREGGREGGLAISPTPTPTPSL